MEYPLITMVMVPEEEWKEFKNIQQEILERLKGNGVNQSPYLPIKYITAVEFMEAVRIKRTKFDMLVQANKVKTIKKDRKVYVPIEEVERYFKNLSN